jgi:hypothetical protein
MSKYARYARHRIESKEPDVNDLHKYLIEEEYSARFKLNLNFAVTRV